ncbi:hypothetical protein [Arthrobacter sp. zg-Y1110]|uniref:hypothetical protein n=1 Tax=Arthrobacter sp. zg-Y1110 TaxID=2886932 RepID=UPI001D15A42D|nr:hypothetical protein [Arthrobacter sp. zg-Y1110]MCC3292531.1 hypothetical protein [Arthrobacter sp. zg-Y1110]UWX87037.1 hypothetical protein N2K99_16940 [Arthrobacter sp. zg-Y1110]
MSTADDRPLILLDVDGNILTFPDPANDFSDPRVSWAEHPDAGRYNPRVVPWLHELATLAEVRWLTSWHDEARTVLAPALGLPDFEVEDYRRYSDPGTDYKIQAVRRYLAAGRRVVWIDDDIPHSHAYDDLFHRGQAGSGLFMVRPTIEDGLTEAHMMRIRSFLAG